MANCCQAEHPDLAAEWEENADELEKTDDCVNHVVPDVPSPFREKGGDHRGQGYPNLRGPERITEPAQATFPFHWKGLVRSLLIAMLSMGGCSGDWCLVKLEIGGQKSKLAKPAAPRLASAPITTGPAGNDVADEFGQPDEYGHEDENQQGAERSQSKREIIDDAMEKLLGPAR